MPWQANAANGRVKINGHNIVRDFNSNIEIRDWTPSTPVNVPLNQIKQLLLTIMLSI